jgi:hypothetical protein
MYQNMTPEWLIAELGPRWYPNRGIGPIPPTDPVIYRLFEASQTHPTLFFLCLCFVLFQGRAGIRPCNKGTPSLIYYYRRRKPPYRRIGSQYQAVIHEKVSE